LGVFRVPEMRFRGKCNSESSIYSDLEPARQQASRSLKDRLAPEKLQQFKTIALYLVA